MNDGGGAMCFARLLFLLTFMISVIIRGNIYNIQMCYNACVQRGKGRWEGQEDEHEVPENIMKIVMEFSTPVSGHCNHGICRNTHLI